MKSFNIIYCVIVLHILNISCNSNKNTPSNKHQKGSPVIIDSSFNIENKNMRMNILNMQLNKDILSIEINYSGGCKEHSFNLYSNGLVVNNNMQLFLVDTQNEDFCKMLITDTLYFNLKSLRKIKKDKLYLTVNRNEQIIQY
ncbi:MAG: hypothetical protein ACK4IK_11160 [Bacteroidia bacterium]